MQGMATAPAVTSTDRVSARWPALALLAFGVLLLYGVGFTSLSVAHNAAHDTRHATGFPCH